jgi:hypothetical protein
LVTPIEATIPIRKDICQEEDEGAKDAYVSYTEEASVKEKEDSEKVEDGSGDHQAYSDF